MDQVPPTYYKWPQFDEYCPCGNRTGCLQRQFQKDEKDFLSQGMNLSDARIEIFKKLGITTMCCIRTLTYFPRNLICDSHGNASVDITIGKGKTVNENVRTGNNQAYIGWELLPKTKGKMGFDQNAYCQKLALMTRSDFNKVAILRRDGSATIKEIPQFPGYRVIRKENYPALIPEFPIISTEELTLENLNDPN